jgi:hypothetical protein
VNLPSYEILIRGHLDAAASALFAEYDLADVPADIALHDLPMTEVALSRLLRRARELGLDVMAIRRAA